ncbi:MAG: apolipoprotein N-acyltransferase [Kordiimonadaceae bacterium]|nr:apolipoprotein N-acyltransferase [Kordiimonadaceae bacterium]MBO6568025.1 apolipoprotein N-acyltransferase [Kordiimonadaceae bacterium]MBO6964245.1 apolipoprotein N-acyltransferase [Kordiimonadaceae bacterium]
MTDKTAAASSGEAAQSIPVWLSRFDAWLSARAVWRVPLIAFLSGALLTSTFAPVNIFPAAFVAFPLMVILLDRSNSWREAFSTGWWTGFGLFSVGLTWIGHSFTQQDNVPIILAPFAILALAGVMALYTALSFVVCQKLWFKGPGRVLLFSAVWVFFEFARGFLFTGFPWHLAGSMWADWLPVAQSASLLSVYGLSAITLLAATSLAVLLSKPWSARGLVLALAPSLVLIGLAVWGQVRLSGAQTEYEISVSLRLVQANVSQREKWVAHLVDDHFDRHMRLSRGDSERGRAEGVKLLIWPETAVQRESFDRDGSLLRWRMSRLLEFGSYAITGAPRYERTPSGVNYFNSLFAFNSRGQLYARYDKNHLVPFGEYLPFQNLLNAIGLRQLTGGVAFTEGDGLQTIRLPGVPPFSPLVCYEIIFPGQVYDPGDRPEWLLNITNDGWFGLTNGPYQHLALARFRAIEEGLPVVRSASTGVSAVIDAHGRTVAAMGVDRAGVLDTPLPRAIAPPAVQTSIKMLAVLAVSVLVILVFLLLGLHRQKTEAEA